MNYISKYISKEVPRPTALFVEQCLQKILKQPINFNANEKFPGFYADLTEMNRVEWSLSRLFDEKRLTLNHFAVLDTLKMAVYFRYCFGFPYVFSALEGKHLFKRSFGILVGDLEFEV
ncbi:hypothetical protein HDU92_007604 [Lobulomyces angularis]|nr:hypothetical protein HDU92_007604 [Lobulomyces angularis]